MHRLILLRHGKAESVSATGGDFDRALTDRGRRDSALMGRVLAEAGMKPDLALVSAARRTQETWEEVARAFPAAHVEIARNLYLAAPEQIEAAIEAVTDGVSVIVIGHNPGLHELALSLAGPVAELQSFPTAAAAIFRIEAGGSARLERVILPRDHGGGPT
jgi:phosphohistidine phosphatase